MSRPGTIAGVIVGGITVIVWKQLSGGLFDLYEIVPGVIVSAAAMVIVSKLAPVRAPPAEV
jgi:sodium/proline symporter